mgnify:CR=1 FL=1
MKKYANNMYRTLMGFKGILMKKIVIGIACHKESELPKNNLYLPIHVGSAIASKNLPGLQRDDEGDSISEKNPMYCELTAQYWLWKNVDADYYGLCHYRRFISFAPKKFTNLSKDNRKQVIIQSLNKETMQDYYLENEEEMRRIIESHDIVATEEQNLSKVYTPRGNQNTVYKHFAAHDRDLINVHDLDKMLEIVEDKYPQYAKDMREYLNAPYFRGYNCFVMKKELFFELCAYEFDVLAELEKYVDFSTYDMTRTRIYGFMAEILYSSFVYHVKKSRSANVYDAQMLFFMDSDPKKDIVPNSEAVPVVFDATKMPSFLFDVTARSFIKSLDKNQKYDVLVLHDELTSFYRKQYAKLFSGYDNVIMHYLDWGKVVGAMADIAIKYNDGPRSKIIEEEFDAYLDFPQLLLPWVLKKYHKAIIFKWNLLFERDWSRLLAIDLHGKSIAAAKDVQWQGEINNILDEKLVYVTNFLKIQNFLNCFDTAVLVEDFDTLRSRYSFEIVVRHVFSFGEVLPIGELMNSIYEDDVEYFEQSYNAKTSTDCDFEAALNDAPLSLSKEHKKALDDPYILQYDGRDPWWMVGTDFEVEYWSIARQSNMYEAYIEYMVCVHDGGRGGEGPLRHRLNEMLPKGTKRRAFAKELFPHGSSQYRFVKDVVRRLAN